MCLQAWNTWGSWAFSVLEGSAMISKGSLVADRESFADAERSREGFGFLDVLKGIYDFPVPSTNTAPRGRVMAAHISTCEALGPQHVF